jgi:hypothetical protein
MEFKTCFKCGVSKDRSEFCAHSHMSDQLRGKCKECTKLDVKRHYLANPDKMRAYERKRTQFSRRKLASAHYKRSGRAKHPEKYKARMNVSNALRAGRLVRKSCEYPGCENTKTEAHHRDYSKPLEVEWYCHHHHRVIEGRIATL